MTIWHDCKMSTLYYSADEAGDSRCAVRLEPGYILVEYEDEGRFYHYTGNEKGEGHYQLHCAENNGKATLHRFAESTILEGFWRESGVHGMWRIELGGEAAA